MAEKEIERIIKLLEDEAVHMIEEKARHKSSDLEQYFSGREAGILLAMAHLKKRKDEQQDNKKKGEIMEIEKLYDILRDSDHTYHAAAVEYVYKNHQYSLDMESIRFKGYHDGNQCICWVNVDDIDTFDISDISKEKEEAAEIDWISGDDTDISKEIEAADLIQKTDFLTWADDLWRQYIETGVI